MTGETRPPVGGGFPGEVRFQRVSTDRPFPVVAAVLLAAGIAAFWVAYAFGRGHLSFEPDPCTAMGCGLIDMYAFGALVTIGGPLVFAGGAWMFVRGAHAGALIQRRVGLILVLAAACVFGLGTFGLTSPIVGMLGILLGLGGAASLLRLARTD